MCEVGVSLMSRVEARNYDKRFDKVTARSSFIPLSFMYFSEVFQTICRHLRLALLGSPTFADGFDQ